MSKRVYVVLAAVLAVLVLGGVGVWWFVLRDTAPPAASLPEPPVSSAPGSTTGASEGGATDGGAATTAGVPGAPTTTSPGPAGLDGAWTVQPGPEVFAGYRVQEQFANDTVEKTAVGRSPVVSGRAEFSGLFLAAATFEVDLTQLRSDSDRRDGRVQGTLDTAQFPTAVLAVTEPVRLPGPPVAGEPVAVQIPATLTLKGVSQPVVLAVEGRWNSDDTVDVAGGTEIVFSDFGIEPPNVGGFVEVDDRGTMEFVVRMVRG